MISAHFNAGFSKENAKPTSLMYVLNADTNTAQWATYENELSDWTAQYLGTDKKVRQKNCQIIPSAANMVRDSLLSQKPP